MTQAVKKSMIGQPTKEIVRLKYVALERELSEKTGKKVDLVMKTALRPVFRENIISEVIYI